MAVNWDWALIWRGALNRHLIYGSQNDTKYILTPNLKWIMQDLTPIYLYYPNSQNVALGDYASYPN